MKLQATIAGRQRLIEIRGSEVLVDDRKLEADAVLLRPGVYSILLGGRSLEVFLEETDPGSYVVHVNGRRAEASIRDPRRFVRSSGGRAADGPQTVPAPMPGKVVRLLAEVGQAVDAGQGLLVVEAMKMQNEIRSPKAGAVKAITVELGSSVTTGQSLIVIE